LCVRGPYLRYYILIISKFKEDNKKSHRNKRTDTLLHPNSGIPEINN